MVSIVILYYIIL